MHSIAVKKLAQVCIFFTFAPAWADAATLYMCRSNSGGSFWSNAHCGSHNALVERIVSVPDGLPFDQQVQLGEQNRADGRRLLESPPPNAATTNNSQNKQNECPYIDARIKQLDQLARQPQSGQAQDAISEERRRLRDRQFQIPCR